MLLNEKQVKTIASVPEGGVSRVHGTTLQPSSLTFWTLERTKGTATYWFLVLRYNHVSAIK